MKDISPFTVVIDLTDEQSEECPQKQLQQVKNPLKGKSTQF